MSETRGMTMFDPCSATKSKSTASSTRGQGRVVLVVDDEPLLRRTLRMLLTTAGFKTLEAKRGDDAIALVESEGNVIDAAVVDRSMPGMSGEDAARAMRTLRPSLPIVLMSGFDHGSDVAGVASIAKPFEPESLITLVEHMIGSARANPQA